MYFTYYPNYLKLINYLKASHYVFIKMDFHVIVSIIETYYGSQVIEMLKQLKQTFCELLKYLDTHYIHYYYSIRY